MATFSPSNFLDTLYNDYFLKDKNNWNFDPRVHKYVRDNLSFITDHDNKNVRKHYELLRFIIYQLCRHQNDEEYLDFLKATLFTLLEENGISLEHILNNKEKLHSLLSIPELYDSFDHGDGTIRISNTKIHQFIDEIFKNNKTICNKIKSHIDSVSSVNTSRRYHPYTKKGGQKKYTAKKNNKKKKTYKKKKQIKKKIKTK